MELPLFPSKKSFYPITMIFLCSAKRGFAPMSIPLLAASFICRDRLDRERGKRIAICLRNSFPFTSPAVYSSPHNLECIAAFIYASKRSQLTVSPLCFLLLSISIISSTLFQATTLFSYLENSTATIFHCSYFCSMGETLFKIFTNHNLLVVNRRSPTHFSSDNSANFPWIDLAFVSPHIYPSCS